MILQSRTGEKGQVVIPKPLRDEFGIQPGDSLLFAETEDGILIKKATSFADFAEALAKKTKKSIDPRTINREEEIDEKWSHLHI